MLERDLLQGEKLEPISENEGMLLEARQTSIDGTR